MVRGRYDAQLKIPCFSITREQGDSIRFMLPSRVALFVPQKQANSLSQSQLAQQIETSENISGKLNNLETGNPLDRVKPYMLLSPNPAHDIAYINYGVPQPSDVQMDVKNAAGQVIFTQILRGVQTGTVPINTQNWANNVYIVEMRFGKEAIRQKLVVQR